MPTSRRKFLETIVGSSVFASLRGGVAAALAEPIAGFSPRPSRAVAYVASGAGDSSSTHPPAIHVFAVRGSRWTMTQRLASDNIAALALHPSGQCVFTVGDRNGNEGLPCGTASAYKVDPNDGSLTLINRQNLSLSSIGPRHLAVSPDGSDLAVAVHCGGAYNLLPVAPSGVLGPVMARWKETGCGRHPVHQASAHPHTVIFDRSGRYMIATDQGSDRISVFELQGGEFLRRQQMSSAGGPGHAVLHSSGSLLFVSNALDGSIDSYRVGASNGEILERLNKTNGKVVPASNFEDGMPLALHPLRNVLYSANTGPEGGSISAWAIDMDSGRLSRLQSLAWNGNRLRELVLGGDGRTLLAIDPQRECILGFAIEPRMGTLAQPIALAHVPRPVSLTLKQG